MNSDKDFKDNDLVKMDNGQFTKAKIIFRNGGK
jgi:hypothetical protein